MTAVVADLSHLRASDAHRFGAKAANLGDMMHAGFDVPPGFVIDIETKSMNDSLRREIDVRLDSFSCDATFAVRSSSAYEDGADRSWAGQFDSFLNVRRLDVPSHIERCWASVFSARATAYAKNAGAELHANGLGVIVQRFVPAEIAGICFTRHPVTKDETVLVIEAATGLGQAIVGGMITPDTYVMRKGDGSVVERNISRQTRAIVPTAGGGTQTLDLVTQKRPLPKLSLERLQRVRTVCLAIERHFGTPQDIEFTIVGSSMAVVQARPITA